MLTFTTGDWSQAQTVTVSGVADDDTADESLSVNLTAASSDGEYEGKNASVAVDVIDDDTADLVVSEPPGCGNCTKQQLSAISACPRHERS